MLWPVLMLSLSCRHEAPARATRMIGHCRVTDEFSRNFEEAELGRAIGMILTPEHAVVFSGTTQGAERSVACLLRTDCDFLPSDTLEPRCVDRSRCCDFNK